MNGSLVVAADRTTASVTSFTYNSLGQLTKITDPLGRETNITYNSAGLIATITDAQSNVTSYTYDARGNRTSVTDPNGKTTDFTYPEIPFARNGTIRVAGCSSFAYMNPTPRTVLR